MGLLDSVKGLFGGKKGAAADTGEQLKDIATKVDDQAAEDGDSGRCRRRCRREDTRRARQGRRRLVARALIVPRTISCGDVRGVCRIAIGHMEYGFAVDRVIEHLYD